MSSETSSSEDEETTVVVSVAGATSAGVGGADKRGKHRILAELKRLDQDSKFLQVTYLLFSSFVLPLFNLFIYLFICLFI